MTIEETFIEILGCINSDYYVNGHQVNEDGIKYLLASLVIHTIIDKDLILEAHDIVTDMTFAEIHIKGY